MIEHKSVPIAPLGYALLCEIGRAPRGGYALRRTFATSPLGVFSSSPGSVYPALKRLQSQGLIRAIGAGRGARFELTTKGEASVEAWFSRPVTLEEISSHLDLCLLRFAFLEGQSDPGLARGFLVSLIGAVEAREAELSSFLEGEAGRTLPLHGRLAVQHGVASIRSTKEWATGALEVVTNGEGAEER